MSGLFTSLTWWQWLVFAVALGALAVEMLVAVMYRNETGVPRDQPEILLSGEWWDGTTLPPRRRTVQQPL